MSEEARIICTKLSSMPTVFILEKHRGLTDALEKKLYSILDRVDILDPDETESLDYFLARIIIQLVIHDRVDVREFVHELQQENGAFSDPLEFDAAVRIIHDWCKTGGQTAKEIGYPLN